jgi:alcohol dehydrogenase class IV
MESGEFFFELDNRIYYGFGWTRKIADLLEPSGFNRVDVLVDEGVKQHNPYFEEILEVMRRDGREVRVEVLRGASEPDYDYVDSIADLARAGETPDAVIGIGGGSTLDVAKAVAGLLTNEGPAMRYRGDDQFTNPAVPTIIIPTTAGTGSEATTSASFIDRKSMMKLGINGRYMNARYAVLDAEWTLSCPFLVAASAGIDALVHTVESFMTTNANPLSRALNREAFRMLYRDLPTLADDPNNAERRQSLLLGAYIAAAALFNTGSGVAGALSYPLGVYNDVPHGVGGGIFIATITEFNVQRGYYDYADLVDAVEPHPDWTAQRKAERFVEMLKEISAILKVPKTLTQWGVTRANLGKVVATMEPLQAAFDQNPLPFSFPEDVTSVLEQHTE